MDSLRDLGRTPVHGADAFAPDLDPDYQALTAEIDALGKTSEAGRGVAWDVVLESARRILSAKCKHLQVAVYLAVALMRTKGLEGFVVGTAILADIVHLHWETMLPPLSRRRGRINVLFWWQEQARRFVTTTLEQQEPAPAGLGATLAAACDALQKGLYAALGDEAPLLTEFSRFAAGLTAAERLPDAEGPEPSEADCPSALPSLPPTATAPEGHAARLPDSSAQTAAAGDETVAPSSSESAPQGAAAPSLAELLETALAGMRECAASCAASGEWNEMRAAILCQSLWLPVLSLPESGSDGVSGLPAPDPALRDRILGTSGGDPLPHEAAIMAAAAASALCMHRFWLDAVYALAMALRTLDGAARGAADRLIHEARAFHGRHPGWAGLRFADGTPVASPQTAAFFEKYPEAPTERGVVRPFFQTPPAMPPGTDAGHGIPDAPDALQEAALRGDLEYIHRFRSALPLSGQRELLVSLCLSQAFIARKQAPLAAIYARQARELMHKHLLDEWEPGLAAKGWETVIRIAMSPGSALRQERDEALEHLVRLDPVLASELALEPVEETGIPPAPGRRTEEPVMRLYR